MFVFQEANSGASCAVIQEGVEVVVAVDGWIGIFAPEVHMCHLAWFGRCLLRYRRKRFDSLVCYCTGFAVIFGTLQVNIKAGNKLFLV